MKCTLETVFVTDCKVLLTKSLKFSLKKEMFKKLFKNVK